VRLDLGADPGQQADVGAGGELGITRQELQGVGGVRDGVHPSMHGIESAEIALALEVAEHPIEKVPRLGGLEKGRRQIGGSNHRQAQRGERSLEHPIVADSPEPIVEICNPQAQQTAQFRR
jgi:hypothetical protein